MLVDPIFRALAPGVDAAPRTTGAEGDPSNAELGYLHCGPNGAGHFVKMVHNGIEYAMMASCAEGLNILRHANAGKTTRTTDAETTPLRHPDLYRYDIDIAQVAEVWRRGSVIASWLLDLAAAELRKSPDLDDFAGRVSDSGEGRWTLQAAIDESVPACPRTATRLRNVTATRKFSAQLVTVTAVMAIPRSFTCQALISRCRDRNALEPFHVSVRPLRTFVVAVSGPVLQAIQGVSSSA